MQEFSSALKAEQGCVCVCVHIQAYKSKGVDAEDTSLRKRDLKR